MLCLENSRGLCFRTESYERRPRADMKGNIIEENHYYSFGLKIAAISSKKFADSYDGKINNPFLYNGKEMLDDDADLNWYDYGFRSYDPQIGRFMQLDPLTDSYPYYTHYQFAGNDPITNVDLDGLEEANAVGVAKKIAGEWVQFSGSSGLSNVIISATRSTEVVGRAADGHKIYRIIRTTSTVIQATSAADRFVRSGITYSVSEST